MGGVDEVETESPLIRRRDMLLLREPARAGSVVGLVLVLPVEAEDVEKDDERMAIVVATGCWLLFDREKSVLVSSLLVSTVVDQMLTAAGS